MNDKLETLIDEVIVLLNPILLDDDIADALQDWENREEAIDYLIEKLQKIKAE